MTIPNRTEYLLLSEIASALMNDKRILIMKWLKDPESHFAPQKDGNVVKDWVSGILIAERLKVSQPKASAQLRALSNAGLLKSKKVKKWIFYQRNVTGLKAARRLLTDIL